MIHLVIVSVVWAFSFGLIKTYLGGVHAFVISFVRMLISLVVFAPFLRLKGMNLKLAVKLVLIGMVQYGLMYITYIYSYRLLEAHQVALFTIFTPLYVTLINDVMGRRFRLLFCLTSLLAIVGTGIVVFKEFHRSDLRLGLLLLQVANVCFAFGQIAYKRLMTRHPGLKDRNVFGLLYFGAFVITAAFAATADWQSVRFTTEQVTVLLYLGVVASGVCFFLWNYGARRANAGALAVCNNLKVPLAVVCALVVFGEWRGTNVTRLLVGGAIIVGSLFLNEWMVKRTSPPTQGAAG